ncbi:PDZ domain-containing protein [Congregibacter brevis]|uniref:PDZ domain-containing protein n=1 Tax=Congregibacter brevis TaxID=3081201 RepID=A0ABZ0IA60_9GAMM|nr:PDZ domain-containing protein [Congregibacter sp. IMCC45268]
MNKYKCLAVSTALLCANSTAFAAHHEGPGNKGVAEGWFEASCGDLAGFIEYVDTHMADDGVFSPDRYVGLGFTVDNDEGEDFATIMSVTAGTPAASVLKAGDQFVSVNGMASTYENRDKTTFRGKPGEPVKAVIVRDGKEMSVEVNRGIIAAKNEKSTVLKNLGMANADDWGTGECRVLEVVAEGDVVYMATEYSDTETETGYPYTSRQVNRMKFNADGKIVEATAIGEDRFVLEQLGYTISR